MKPKRIPDGLDISVELTRYSGNSNCGMGGISMMINEYVTRGLSVSMNSTRTTDSTLAYTTGWEYSSMKRNVTRFLEEV